MDQSNTSAQQKRLDLQQGVYVIRYTMSEDQDMHPTIGIKVDAGSESDIFLVLPNQDVRESVLWRPGTSIAVRAQRAGRVLIEVQPVHVNSSTNATIKIDTLIQGDNTYELFGERNTAAATAADFETLKLHGHVAGRGDIAVGGQRVAWRPGRAGADRGLYARMVGKAHGHRHPLRGHHATCRSPLGAHGPSGNLRRLTRPGAAHSRRQHGARRARRRDRGTAGRDDLSQFAACDADRDADQHGGADGPRTFGRAARRGAM